jgi:hypothetical protein
MVCAYWRFGATQRAIPARLGKTIPEISQALEGNTAISKKVFPAVATKGLLQH